MQPAWLCILQSRQFEATFDNAQRREKKNATIVTMHLPWQAFWRAIQKYTAKKNQDWCNHCDYVSYQAGHLRTQLKIHSGKKPTKCEFVSSQAGNLRIHLERHSEDETKRCSPWNNLTHENINWKSQIKAGNALSCENSCVKLCRSIVAFFLWL